ncbi:MAG: hypothetical protein B0D92_00810 [Spirochaeta sp. LUC14_002_19_P3]|nr:MAG: hypothetical protein B0D92_00810 [Spirochaeta sp. LUC14_002_19_P3]
MPFKLSVLFILFTVAIMPVAALELILNQRLVKLLSPEELYSLTETGDGEELPAIPLAALFPWLESIDILEMQAGTELTRREAPQLNLESWNTIRLVYNNSQWELWINQETLAAPDSISVIGTELSIPEVRIWVASDNENFKPILNAALAFRNLKTSWRSIHQPKLLLASTAPEQLPHLIFLDDLALTRSLYQLPLYRRIHTAPFPSPLEPPPHPSLSDMRKAENALPWLLAVNPALFDKTGRLPGILPKLLNSTRNGGNMADMETVETVRYNYVAIPANLPPADAKTALLVLRDTLRHIPENNTAAALPIDPRTALFFDAYNRIARLALSNQITPENASLLINSYILGQQDLINLE